MTSWQALFDVAKLKKGETILIHAGAGGVGSLAIQLAKNAGAKVFTTASQNNHAYVKKLGADVAIDYKTQDFNQEIKKLVPEGLDVVLDTQGKKTLLQSLDLLKPQGRHCQHRGTVSILLWQSKKMCNLDMCLFDPMGCSCSK